MKQANPPRGATLVELIVGIVVMLAVTTLAVSHVVRHLRAANAISAALELNARLRDGADILAAELRGISPPGDSLTVAADTAMEFYSAIGSSTLCARPAPNTITLPPDSLPSGRALSSWVVAPEAGDDVLIFGDSTPSGVPGWQRASVQGVAFVATSDGCPASAGLLSATDAAGAARSVQISMAPSVVVAATRGAPVRIVRRVRYSVYRGGDRKWYLGYRRCPASCGPIQPVSGPYESESGRPISFRYYTRAGAAVWTSGAVADVGRVDLIFRASYATSFRLPGMREPIVSDSVVASVALRNRW